MDSSAQIVEMLERAAQDLSPEAFKKAFEYAMGTTEEKDVLARLMWIAGMYLDRHPGAFRLPRELAEDFLVASDFDQLLAGLKGVRHSGAPIGEIVAHFTNVMQREAWEEKHAALYQLHNLVGSSGATLAGEIHEVTLGDLQTVLRQIAENGPDEHACNLAARCGDVLRK